MNGILRQHFPNTIHSGQVSNFKDSLAINNRSKSA